MFFDVSFALRQTVLLLAFVISLVLSEAIDFPVGISLGQYSLSSAYYTAQNELIAVATIASSKEWQDYSNRFLWGPKYPEYDEDPMTVAMVSRTLSAIQDATEVAMKSKPEYRAITVPGHLNTWAAKAPIVLAAERMGYFPAEHLLQIIYLYNAARLAYNLDNCEAFGLSPGCDVDDQEFLVLIIEYSPAYLSMSFLLVGGYSSPPVGKRFLPQYGEAIIGKNLVSRNHSLSIDIVLSVRNFMAEMIAKMKEDKIKSPESKVLGVILAGEASSAGMEGMKEVISSALPEYADYFLFWIDPSFVGAVGAAHRARQYVVKHGILDPREGLSNGEL